MIKRKRNVPGQLVHLSKARPERVVHQSALPARLRSHDAHHRVLFIPLVRVCGIVSERFARVFIEFAAFVDELHLILSFIAAAHLSRSLERSHSERLNCPILNSFRLISPDIKRITRGLFNRKKSTTTKQTVVIVRDDDLKALSRSYRLCCSLRRKRSQF